MKLLLDFEVALLNLMNCDPSSSLDMCYGELLREEQCLVTWATFQQDKLPINVVVPMLLK
jgi:hypothetical protein